MRDLIEKINSCKKDVVFVGGVAEMLQGFRTETRDIDICVLSLNGLETLGKIKQWETKSVFSTSGKRAGIETKDYTTDIFLEENLPEFVVVNGFKCETVHSLINRYTDIIKKLDTVTDFYSKNKMIKKLNNLCQQ